MKRATDRVVKVSLFMSPAVGDILWYFIIVVRICHLEIDEFFMRASLTQYYSY